jgi:heme-degrading monooxygenase HmoA
MTTANETGAPLAATPEPPYYAVIFSSVGAADRDGYTEMAAAMDRLAARQPGYLGQESAGDDDFGITVSYWRSEDDIANWRRNAEHRVAQRLGRERWYADFRIRVAKVERETLAHRRTIGVGEQTNG